MTTTARLYRAREFAELTGVTVRALHHYDRLGLLSPRRGRTGYRLYCERDLGRLEQIVVLKFLGLPLEQIRRLLEGEAGLADALHRQQRVLADKRRHLDGAIDAIAQAERMLRAKRRPDWTLFKHIIAEVEMQQDTEWSKKYYSPDAQAKVEERKKLWSPELQAEVSRNWSELYADIESAIERGDTPESDAAQTLAARWRKLLEGFTGGDPEVQKGLNKLWADQQNWPEKAKASYAIKPAVQMFITKAMTKSAK